MSPKVGPNGNRSAVEGEIVAFEVGEMRKGWLKLSSTDVNGSRRDGGWLLGKHHGT